MIEVPVIRNSAGVVRPAFTVTVDLVGALFDISFRWNGRAEAWFMGFGPTGGAELVSNVVVRVGGLLLPILLSGFPLGTFFALDTSRSDLDPGREDLGARVRVYFMGPGDLP